VCVCVCVCLYINQGKRRYTEVVSVGLFWLCIRSLLAVN
jgi:hypothetical protein